MPPVPLSATLLLSQKGCYGQQLSIPRTELLLIFLIFSTVQAGGRGEGVHPAWEDAQQKAEGVH